MDVRLGLRSCCGCVDGTPAANVSGAGFVTITSTANESSNADASERKIRLGLRLSR